MDKGAPPPPGFHHAQPQPNYAPPPYPTGQPNVIVVTANPFGPETQRVTCPHCHADISTRVESEPNSKTHLFALLLCLIGCWCCAPFPYCTNSCLVQKHYCPACKNFLGQCEN